jgi:hypothetical protein
MGETTSERISSWTPGSRRRKVLAWAAVAAILVLGWGAYAGTLLSIAGLHGWSGIACDGEYRPASCASTSGWRQFEMTITLAQLVALPILVFKGIRSASGAGSTAAGCVGSPGPADLYRSGTPEQLTAQLPPVASAENRSF